MQLSQTQAFLFELFQKLASILFLLILTRKISVEEFGDYGYITNVLFFATILSTQGLDVLSNRFLPYYKSTTILGQLTRLKNQNAIFFSVLIILILSIQKYSPYLVILMSINLFININLNLWHHYYNKQYFRISLFKMFNVVLPIIYLILVENSNVLTTYLVVVFSLMVSAFLFVFRDLKSRSIDLTRFSNLRVRKLGWKFFYLLILTQVLFRFDPFLVKRYLSPIEFGKYEFHSRMIFLLVMVLNSLMDVYKIDFLSGNKLKTDNYNRLIIVLSVLSFILMPIVGSSVVKILFPEYYINQPYWYFFYGLLASVVLLSYVIVFPAQLVGRIRIFQKSLTIAVLISLSINVIGYYIHEIYVPLFAMIAGLLSLNISYLLWKE
jgi:O-antigen/teichoic acid export membrane protein